MAGPQRPLGTQQKIINVLSEDGQLLHGEHEYHSQTDVLLTRSSYFVRKYLLSMIPSDMQVHTVSWSLSGG